MTGILATALAIMLLLCLWAYSRSISAREYERKSQKAWEMELMREKKAVEHSLSGVLDVMRSSMGGIDKRISENIQIADAIQSNAPELFKRCPGVAYWLHANDQFLRSLYDAAPDCLPSERRHLFDEIEKAGRAEVFDRIYASAALRPPQGIVAGVRRL